MAISFKMLPKKNMLLNPPQIRYYPIAVSQGETTISQLSEIISSRSTVTKADIYASLISLTEVIGEELAKGRIVRLLELGSFQITLQGLPAESSEAIGKSNIKNGRIVFKPGQKLKKMLQSLDYKRLW